MADIIQLLPDAIANQIAAGEVIQRPASVVKELLENAIDAGSTSVKLIIKDAGRTLIQVIDNGCGMTETDARMAFERHATSKIRKSDDLFAIRTMGFRGEALASIAAIAQVELKSRQQVNDLGTRILIERSEVQSQEPCQCATGTSISVKNLFYNVPARRNFLKSNTVEMRHVLDEFQRLAIANPDVFFSLHHNNTEMFHLPPGNLRQRIIGIFGANTNKKLVPVNEATDDLKLEGFAGKPEFAKKTRGEQLFFVNNRFIKSGYLNHAVMSAYEGVLPPDTFPLYVIFIDINPKLIDINVHPTKQEIKFEDEKLVYHILKVAVRHALAQHSVMPTLDFDQDSNFSNVRIPPSPPTSAPTVETYPSRASLGGQAAKPSGSTGSSGGGSVDDRRRHQDNLKHWEKLYEGLEAFDEDEDGETEELIVASAANETVDAVTIESQWETTEQEQKGHKTEKPPYQIHQRYIVSQIKSGFVLIDQQAAHERILYEEFQRILQEQKASSQRLLFPATITLPPADATLLTDIRAEINQLGFDIQDFGPNAFVINAVPAELGEQKNTTTLIEGLLEQYKNNLTLQLDVRDNIAAAMAKSAAIRTGQRLTEVEMKSLINRLFACTQPYRSPGGKSCFITFELEELGKRFGS
ncbi:MAG: DNA mismatch repair endonuclease MutL [Bacteroidota bacterium]